MKALANDHPRFAVVGHPNKGKSTIVSTLAYDDSVQISSTPGTTIHSREFPLRIDGEVLYTLIDTPGFQRARRVLAWLQQHEVDAASRSEIVRRFVDEHEGDDRYVDECELLRPIIDGAGILYVVDGSQPWGAEYEAEMEILRWTGQPSMALINRIGDQDHSADWRRALGQYFRLVRTFNPLKARFSDHVALLEGLAQINEGWLQAMRRAISVLQLDREQRLQRSAEAIADSTIAMLCHVESKRLGAGADEGQLRPKLEQQYRQWLGDRETRCRREIETLWRHRDIDRDEDALNLLDLDLFSAKSWSVFGLTRTQLLLTGVVGGAAVGSGVDAAFLGHLLGIGTGVGALIGGATAWLGYDELINTRVLGLPLGGEELRVGPMKNPNFPWVVIGRALLHANSLLNRSHAYRDALRISPDDSLTERWTSGPQRRNLERAFARIRKDAPDHPPLETVTALQVALLEVLKELDERPEGTKEP